MKYRSGSLRPIVHSFKKFFEIGTLTLCLSLLSHQALAKTLQQLEDEILRGKTSSDPEAEIDSPEASIVSDGDQSLPELSPMAQPNVDEDDVEEIEEKVRGPRRIPHDHILVVQRRYIQKSMNHEIIPFLVGFQPADSFRKQVQYGFGYAFHLSETFGIEFLHVNVVTNYRSHLAQTIADELNLETDRVEPVISAGASLQWTPLSSKAAQWSSLTYFEGFFIGGGGMSRYEDGNVGMAMAGLGFRVYLTKYALFKAEFRDYMDFRQDQLQHRFNILVGASVLVGD